MKKSILKLASGIAVFLAAGSFGYAQQDKPQFSISNAKSLENVIAISDNGANAKSGSSALNERALREFNKSFKDVVNVNWSKISDGFLATFTRNTQLNRAYFDKKGHQTYIITYCEEGQLPKDIRNQVRSVYYDYTIKMAEKVEGSGKTAYIVHLEGEDSWKKVRVADGEMEILEDFKKG
jgi:hypothetical protein